MAILVTLSVCLLLAISLGLSLPQQDINVEPEYLDSLLENKEYELFSKIMKINDVTLVHPREGERSSHPMLHHQLAFGDIVLTEEQRQGVNFDRRPSKQWPNGRVPYVISSKYDDEEREIIDDAIDQWNADVDCIKFYPRIVSEKDYVMFFSGDGCYSHEGRTEGPQPISIEIDGCMDKETILHEMEHAIGIAHEQNRSDRDDYIEMLWDNIPPKWKDQYTKTDTSNYRLLGKYDYYSIMHYEVDAPDTEPALPAFRVLTTGIDKSRIGKGTEFTDEDLNKISLLYCED